MNPELKERAEKTYQDLQKVLAMMKIMDQGFTKLSKELKKPRILWRSR